MIKYTQLHCLKEMEKLCMNYILYTYSMVMLMTKKKIYFGQSGRNKQGETKDAYYIL